MSNYDFNFSNEAEQTDEELSGDINKLQWLSEEKIQELLPNRIDQDKLREIIQVVNAAKLENEKKAVLMQQLQTISGVVKNVVVNVMKGSLI